MFWLSWHNFLISLFATLVLAFFHFATPYYVKHWKINHKIFASFAGGTAVAFIFLHMLPELIEQKEPIGNLLTKLAWLTPLVDLAVFISALFGFLIY